MRSSIRDRLNRALSGKPIDVPVYAVYDSFVNHYKKVSWESFFDAGLGVINHAKIIDFEMPNLEIIESNSIVDGRQLKKIRWITDLGELSEEYIDGWQQTYFIKSPEDYRIMQRVLTGVKLKVDNKRFNESENSVGDRGITLGQIGSFELPGYNRTPFQVIQIDFAGLERFSIDLMMEVPGLFELLEMMNEQFLGIFRCVLKADAQHIKLWENLSLETMGPSLYCKYLVPVYQKIFDILEGSNKKLHVHYDGKLKCIAEIKQLPFYGVDSITPPPEGDMLIGHARKFWPDKFFWINPSLSWFLLEKKELVANIRKMIEGTGGVKFCLQISEDIPPDSKVNIPLILETLNSL